MSSSTPRYDDQVIISGLRDSPPGDTLLRVLARNPAALAAVFLAGGVLAGTYYGDDICFWYFIGLAVLACSVIIIGLAIRNIYCKCFGVAILFFLIGAYTSLQALGRGLDLEAPADYTLIEATLKGTLASGPRFQTVLLEQGHFGPERSRLPGYGRLVIRQENFACKAGDRLSFMGRIRKPRNRGNPGEFNWELDCRNNGIYWLASVRPNTRITVVSHGPSYSANAVLFFVRHRIGMFLDSAPSYLIAGDYIDKVRAILKAIVIGDLGEISPKLYKSFANSGLAHTLSASGIHVGMAALLGACVAKAGCWIYPRILLWIPLKKIAATSAIPSMIFYCFIVGGRVPVIRATIMGIIVSVAFIFERRWQSLNTLALAAIMVLFLYPLSLFTVSFLLSFGAVAGIIIVSQRLGKGDDLDTPHNSNPKLWGAARRTNNTLARLWDAVKTRAGLIILVSLGAMLGTLPTIWFFFGSLPVYTLVANLIAASFMTGALGFGLLASIVSFISARLGDLFLIPADLFTFLVIKTAETIAGLPYSVFRKAHPVPTQLVLITFAAAFALVLLGRIWKKRFRAILVALCICIFLVFAHDFFLHSQQPLKVYFLNVGKGDSIFLRFPSLKGLLIDGGVANEYFDSGERIVVPFLYWAGVTRLQGLVMTHPDVDHIGGLISVMNYITIEKILWNPVPTDSPYLDRILTAAKEKKIPVNSVTRGSGEIIDGQTRLKFLNLPAFFVPETSGRPKINNASVVIRLDYGETSFLFTGDLEREGEDELVSSGLPLKADVLKIGHHGSANSTSLGFLKAVAPKIAVVSADYPPSGGLPNYEILHRLASFGIKVYWTGRDGAVIMTSDGRSLSIQQGTKSSY